jgi:hypothetical protein
MQIVAGDGLDSYSGPGVRLGEVWASRTVTDLIPVAYGWTMIAVLAYP